MMNERQEIQACTTRLKSYTYQPGKAELEEPAKIDATPDELAVAILLPARDI